MSGNDFFGSFYEKPQKYDGFSWLEGVQGGQETYKSSPRPTVPSPAVTRYRSLGLLLGSLYHLLAREAKASSVLSGIRWRVQQRRATPPHTPPPHYVRGSRSLQPPPRTLS